MSWAIQLVIALVIFVAGAAGGIKWEVGVHARADLAAAEARATDSKQQRQFGDHVSATHAAALATINQQLGDAREKIALLSGRECLDAGTVGMLNNIGVPESSGAAASEPAGSAEAAAGGTALRFATDRDVGEAIAVCRGRYAEVSSQLNQILDIEDRRYPPE